MSESSDETQSLLENAVYQQLFNAQDNNKICGKNPDNTMQVTGVDQLLDSFLTDLKKNLELLKKQKLKEFLQTYEKRFHINLKDTLERIEANFEGMGGMEMLEGQETVLYYMVLTKLLEALREYSYNSWGSDRIKEIYEEQAGKKFNDVAKDKIQNLAALNEENISILYNLSFIAMLSTSYGDKKFITTLKRLVTTRINKIVKQIL
jgi:hypothetical protein